MRRPKEKKKTILVPIIAWLIVLGYLVFGPVIHTYLLRREGRPSRYAIDLISIASKKEARGYLDRITPYLEQPDIFEVIGWGFSMMTPAEPTDVYITHLLVFSNARRYVFETQPNQRASINDTHKNLGLTIVNPGFTGLINKHAIRDGAYCVGIVLTHPENQTSQIILVDKVLRKAPFRFTLNDELDLPCKDYLK